MFAMLFFVTNLQIINKNLVNNQNLCRALIEIKKVISLVKAYHFLVY